MHHSRGGAIVFVVLLAGLLVGAGLLPFWKCPNCVGSGRAEFDIDQDWCGETGDEPIVEKDPGWTTPCARCRSRGRLTLLETRRGVTPTLKPPSIPPTEVLRLFRLRSSPEELSRFEKLRSSSSREDRLRALELVLFSLTSKELFELAITQSGSKEGTYWSVFWSDDSPRTCDAVEAALDPLNIAAGGSMGHGRAGWYVDRTEFFAARRALLADPAIRALGWKVVTPKFKLD